MSTVAVPVDSVELGLFYIKTDLLKPSNSSSWNETLQNFADDKVFEPSSLWIFQRFGCVVNIDE